MSMLYKNGNKIGKVEVEDAEEVEEVEEVDEKEQECWKYIQLYGGRGCE